MQSLSLKILHGGFVQSPTKIKALSPRYGYLDPLYIPSWKMNSTLWRLGPFLAFFMF